MPYYAIAAINILQFYFGINDTMVTGEHVSCVEETGQSHDDTKWGKNSRKFRKLPIRNVSWIYKL